jgi:hypothetical protein
LTVPVAVAVAGIAEGGRAVSVVELETSPRQRNGAFSLVVRLGEGSPWCGGLVGQMHGSPNCDASRCQTRFHVPTPLARVICMTASSANRHESFCKLPKHHLPWRHRLQSCVYVLRLRLECCIHSSTSIVIYLYTNQELRCKLQSSEQLPYGAYTEAPYRSDGAYKPRNASQTPRAPPKLR